MAYTGLRHCHASGMCWEDVDEEMGVVRIVRKNVRGRVGPVTRKKRAPREYPLAPELAEILKAHRRTMIEEQLPGVESGYAFPSQAGTLRHATGLQKAWAKCLDAIGLQERFTVHGLRRTFNDLTRRPGVDAVVIKSLTGHVTEKMREHYSSVGLVHSFRLILSLPRRSGFPGRIARVQLERGPVGRRWRRREALDGVYPQVAERAVAVIMAAIAQKGGS